MSANNYLGISKKGDVYHLGEYDADTGSEYNTPSADYLTLEDAIKSANYEIANHEIDVEYGLRISL